MSRQRANLRQSAHVARCVLLTSMGDWELCVIVDGVTKLAKRCARGTQAFALADEWKRRMLEDGWLQVVPTSPGPVHSSMASSRRTQRSNGSRPTRRSSDE